MAKIYCLNCSKGDKILISKTELQRLYRIINEMEQQIAMIKGDNLILRHRLELFKAENSSIKF